MAAMSKASTSGVNRAYAFFEPSGRMRVLTLTVSTSYIFLRASLICLLLALKILSVVTLRISDLRNVLDVDDEDEGVVLFNLLHGGLGVQWVEEDGAGIEARFVL